MKILTVDQKKRVVLPGVHPGEGYMVRELHAGYMELVKVIPQTKTDIQSPDEALKKMDANPLTPGLSWEELRTLTRE